MSHRFSRMQPDKAAAIQPASVFPPATATAIRRSAWQVTGTLLAMLILIAAMAVLSPRAFPQVPKLPYPAVQHDVPAPTEIRKLSETPRKQLLLIGAAGPENRDKARKEQQSGAMKLWGAGILLLIGLGLLAGTPRAPALRP